MGETRAGTAPAAGGPQTASSGAAAFDGPGEPGSPAADASPGADLVADWLTVPDVGELLGIDVTRVRQLVRDRELVAVRRDGVLLVPAGLVQDGRVLKGLPGLLTLLGDARYTDDEVLRWLYTPDDSLPGRPVDALRENRGTEVKRRAQALGF
jgi:hypothetical protein